MKKAGRKDTKVTYVGREMMAATAVGFSKTHNEQLQKLIKDAFA
jgi:2-oxoglutarate dehydrogenase complex dehydrogenase (E1) component-like enzyme